MRYSWNHRYSFPPFSICLHHCGSSSLWGTLLDRTAEGAKNADVSITIIKIHHVLHIKKGTEESSSLPFSPSTWSVWLGEPVCGVLRALRTCFRGQWTEPWDEAAERKQSILVCRLHLQLLWQLPHTSRRGCQPPRSGVERSPEDKLYLLWSPNPAALPDLIC